MWHHIFPSSFFQADVARTQPVKLWQKCSCLWSHCGCLLNISYSFSCMCEVWLKSFRLKNLLKHQYCHMIVHSYLCQGFHIVLGEKFDYIMIICYFGRKVRNLFLLSFVKLKANFLDMDISWIFLRFSSSSYTCVKSSKFLLLEAKHWWLFPFNSCYISQQML